jgi:TolA-binding protein
LAFVQPVPSPTPVVDDGLDPPTASETAHGLLNQAISERQQGHRQPAILALRSLRRQFPDSPEAVVALVSLGNLLLDVHEPAEALPLFQQYCKESPSGALAPEAMAGQARTLEQLQRSVDAKAMWQELLRRFPGSPYARSKLSLDLEGSHP